MLIIENPKRNERDFHVNLLSEFCGFVSSPLFRDWTKFFMAEFLASGIKVQCSHCKQPFFEASSRQLNTRAAEFFNFGWANKSATTLICLNCGKIEWFEESRLVPIDN